MSYRMRDDDVNAAIEDLLALATSKQGANPVNADLVSEIITTALRLLRDGTGRGDLKMMNTALKELRYSSLVFQGFQKYRKVAVYGSARTKSDDPNYALAEEFGRRIAELDWMVITGAGPGIMEAANKGAGSEASFGVNIRLPFEAGANEYLSPGKVINFKYFFTRKVQFVKESDAFVLMPGGWGTMDEAFELLTLIQTGKSDMHPIVLLEAEGNGYWDPWIELCNSLLDKGMISEADLNLYRVTHDVDAAIDEILGFFSVYHSQRFVGDMLVLRLETDVPDTLVESLNGEFPDIVVSGKISKIEATEAEIETDDNVGLPRLGFHFDRRSFGRLRQLIDRLNGIRS